MSSESSFFRRSLKGRTLKTWYLALTRKQRQIILHPNIKVHIERGYSLQGAGMLELGIKWEGLRYFPGEFKLENGSEMIVNGPTTIFTGMHVCVAKGARLSIGSAYIANDFTLDCYQEITLGQDVGISKGCTLRDSDSHPINSNHDITGPIVIGDHVWVGLHCTILKGVTIGDGAIIGAGSLVTKDIPPRTLAAGVPAKVLREDVWWDW